MQELFPKQKSTRYLCFNKKLTPVLTYLYVCLMCYMFSKVDLKKRGMVVLTPKYYNLTAFFCAYPKSRISGLYILFRFHIQFTFILLVYMGATFSLYHLQPYLYRDTFPVIYSRRMDGLGLIFFIPVGLLSL